MTSYFICTDDADHDSGDRARAALARRAAEIGLMARAGARPDGTGGDPLASVGMPALLIDVDGGVVHFNAAAEALFDDDMRVRQRRLHIRDAEARNRFRLHVEQFEYDAPRPLPGDDPIVIPRQDRLPALLRFWALDPSCRWPTSDVRALATLAPLGPKLGPAPALLSKIFALTPSEAKLASIIARGSGPDVAALELNISRETARNQLKSIFSKTATHRQGELVALLAQV
ncbi:helix-turn-helix transcriptional regulator [Methylocella sp.]|uniref:helix-turn-helix transcriptional regulator n=1 Tax=Methylocella sp. TaxID=1978226 RepID=UPI00378525FA